jgi:predicted DNA repair protein MutK
MLRRELEPQREAPLLWAVSLGALAGGLALMLAAVVLSLLANPRGC